MKIFADNILLAQGWAQQQTLTIEQGVITDISAGCAIDAVRYGTIIPGMVNCHSHAFQRVFAGMTEQVNGKKESFWTWRNIMYQLLEQITAEDVEIIARQLYIEMLKAGYTRVAEFHYLHHDIGGGFYDDPIRMAQAIVKAGDSTGIGVTLLPVLYQYSGFGGLAPETAQQRFIHSPAQFSQLITACFAMTQQYSNVNLGIAPHSLRAVDADALNRVVDHVRSLDRLAPIHIHIAEQQQEVTDSLQHFGQRPVQWLMHNMPVDQHWCLIHATHINAEERQAIIAQQAVVGICPTTEANLGDGIFPALEFCAAQGRFAIGSDSHISVNPIEELRWLEYSQRLVKQQRVLLAEQGGLSLGSHLWQAAALGGAQSTASNTGSLAVGKQADLLVLDDQQLNLFAYDEQNILDSVIFASRNSLIKDVMVQGRWVVQNGQHQCQRESASEFSLLLQRLFKR